MSYTSMMRKLAQKARELSDDTMDELNQGTVKHEDDLTGFLAGAFKTGLKGFRTDGVSWNASVLTHRRSGEEKKYGADLLIHVKLDTKQQKYSKAVFVQAKIIGPDSNMSTRDHGDLVTQCDKMLSVTPASFVFAYDAQGLRAGPATKIAGATERDLYSQCDLTAYRFFYDLFRCPIGDPRITSAKIAKLRPGRELTISGEGMMKPRTRGLQ